MSWREPFVPSRGRAIGLVSAAAAALGCGIAAAPASAHWRPGTSVHRIKAGGARHAAVRPAGEELGGYGEEGGSIHEIASGLNQPKKITIAPDGSLLVALSGDGAPSANCVSEPEELCLDESGAIDRITPSSGHVQTVIGGLPSLASEGEATGPAEARYIGGSLEVVFQDTGISPSTGASPFGSAGALLGTLSKFPVFSKGLPTIQSDFAAFEAANNPDKGEGTGAEMGLESPIDSDPYSFVPYHGGYAVADAAGDDLLWVSPTGHISVLAVFPTIPEIAPPGSLSPEVTVPVPVQAQPVPDSVAVGPDGALYVGELGGFPFNTGSSSIYRVVPGHAPTVVSSGFTAIGDIAFDPTGRLLVLEIDQAGIDDPAAEEGLPTPGALIGIHHDGTKSVLATTGLEFPTGLAVSSHGAVYVSNLGVLPATGGPGGLSGEVVRVGLPGSWWSHH